MTIRIAFTACSKFNFDSEQRVWLEIEQHKPQHLMLLGDQIYMDFMGDNDNGPDGFIGYGLGDPATIPLEEFEFQMQLRYRQQFGVQSFRTLVHAIGQRQGTIAMVWDDHDFGFNNSLGQEGGPSDNKFEEYLMPEDKKQVSRRLFEEFKWNVQRLQQDSSATYQALPDDQKPVAEPFPGVQSQITLDLVDIFMLDTRSFRQSPARKNKPDESSILGDPQWQWLRNGLTGSAKKLVIIAAGSPLSSPGSVSDQSWKQADENKHKPYREYNDLLSLAATLHSNNKRLLFIGGDRHTAAIVEDDPPLPEFVCAGAAAPKLLGNGRHFCLVDVDDQSRAIVRLFRKGKEDDAWPDKSDPLPMAAPEMPAKPAASKSTPGKASNETSDEALLFSDLFLITDRKMDGKKPTDDPDTRLHYFRFGGDRFQGKATRLKNWDELDADTFWAAVRKSADRLHALNPGNPQHICLFVPGNRESSDSAIEQYRTVNDIAFNAQGTYCIGTGILFDWATQMGHFQFKEIYEENIRRAEKAAAWLKKTLESAREVSIQADTRLSLVAHSLGNRVALQALARLPAHTVDRFYANAADLASHAFDSESGKAALQACQSVLVPYTGKDFMLGYAESAETASGPRLGRVGPNAPAPAGVHAKDVSSLVSSTDPHGGLLWYPWSTVEDAGRLQTAFRDALINGHWG